MQPPEENTAVPVIGAPLRPSHGTSNGDGRDAWGGVEVVPDAGNGTAVYLAYLEDETLDELIETYDLVLGRDEEARRG